MRLYSDTVTLVYDSTDTDCNQKGPFDQAVGYFCGLPEPENLVGVGIQPDEGIGWKKWFYIVSGQNFVVIDTNGQMLSQEDEMKMFGSDLRVERFYRAGDTVVFQYRCFT